jgi:hypothetical protein
MINKKRHRNRKSVNISTWGSLCWIDPLVKSFIIMCCENIKQPANAFYIYTIFYKCLSTRKLIFYATNVSSIEFWHLAFFVCAWCNQIIFRYFLILKGGFGGLFVSNLIHFLNKGALFWVFWESFRHLDNRIQQWVSQRILNLKSVKLPCFKILIYLNQWKFDRFLI